MDISRWCKKLPILNEIMHYRETTWFNPEVTKSEDTLPFLSLNQTDIDMATARLERFQPYIASVFPETAADKGIIESPLQPIPKIQHKIDDVLGVSMPGKLLLKCDNLLPVSGSIKARGGIYEVLKYAEHVALENNILSLSGDYSCLAGERARTVFSQYRIVVGSTGNLGLSIGIMGAKLGFGVYVHMSADAREWKKKMLRDVGVKVVEYDGDYSRAVAGGRIQAKADAQCHFIDDENSSDLFLGYAVAAGRLKRQLDESFIPVNSEHPLFVYLPCGVGGGPGGIAFGLKQLYGDNVHIFFAEPTHSPCMLLGLSTGLHDRVSVRDFGLDNITAADGLAVGRPSKFVGELIAPLIDGVYTTDDDHLFYYLAQLSDCENIRMEPSALAGIPGPWRTTSSHSYLQQHGLEKRIANSTHITWGTGGRMVPTEEMKAYYKRGKKTPPPKRMLNPHLPA
ncbi:MAG: D-serine ammonia-lyase [Desulforhopalus sp.]